MTRRRRRGGLGFGGGGGGELAGELAGLHINFRPLSGVGAVTVIDPITPANNKNQVPADQFLTNNTTSPKLVLGADGKLHWTPHNLFLYSQTFSNAAWIKFGCSAGGGTAGPDGTATAYKLTENVDVASYHGLTLASGNLGTADGPLYTWSGYLKAGERSGFVFTIYDGSSSDWGEAVFDLAAGAVYAADASGLLASTFAATITATGNGWYRCTVTFRGTGTSSGIGQLGEWYLRPGAAVVGSAYDGDGVSGLYVWGFQFNRGATALAYHATTAAQFISVPLEYDPVRAEYYLLAEATRTNILTQSQAFDGGFPWAYASSGVTPNTTTAPDGTLTADTLYEGGGSAAYYMAQNLGVPTGVQTFSVYLKKKERGYAYLAFYVLNKGQFFDLNTGKVLGAFGGAPPDTATITAVGNGWWRCSITASLLGGSEFTMVGLSNDGVTSIYTGASGSGAYVWGAQLELGSIATSHIPTFAATVIRANDWVGAPITTFPLSSTVGTWLAQFTLPSAEGVAGRIIGNTTGYRTPMYYTGANLGLYEGSAAETAVVPILLSPDVQKGAIAYSGASAAGSVNGGAVGTAFFDGDFEFTGEMTFGSAPGGDEVFNFNGRIYSVLYIPRRMSTTELQLRTLLDTDEATLLLLGESQGFAIDFTPSSGLGSVSVKGHTTNLNNVPADRFLTQGSGAPKLVLNQGGGYQWTPHNMLLQSEAVDTPFGSGEGWYVSDTIVPNVIASPTTGAMTVDLLAEAAYLGPHMVWTPYITLAAGELYTATCIVKADGRSSVWFGPYGADGAEGVRFPFDLVTGTAGTTPVIGGWTEVSASISPIGSGFYRLSVSGRAASTSALSGAYALLDAGAGINYMGDPTKGMYLGEFQVNRGPVPTAYLPTTTVPRYGVPIEYQGGYYELHEPAGTNLIPSRNFAGTIAGEWLPSAVTVTTNQTAGPDGSIVADKVTDFAGGPTAEVIHIEYTPIAATYTFSVFFKYINQRYLSIRLALAAVGYSHTMVDLLNGVILSQEPGATSSITAFPDGWYRVAIAGLHVAGTGQVAIFFSHEAAPIQPPSYTGDGTHAFYMSDSQIELGSVATSPIVTTTAPTTRPADQVNAPLSSVPFSATAGTIYLKGRTPKVAAAAVLQSFDDGTANERFRITYTGTNLNVVVTDGGVVQATLDMGAYPVDTDYQLTFAWQT